ncbi:MAG TPA: aldehyde dehydrogenase family protein, partial [Devosia sp.]|nr:aldehyde dehydrogenase family protein [Devosia sp.]
MLELRNAYVNGEWVPMHSTAEHLLISPSTEQPIGAVVLGDAGDVDAAVAAARAALPGWSATPLADRIALVGRMREIYTRRLDEMASVISQEMGAPIDLAKSRQAMAAVNHMVNFVTAVKSMDFIRPLGPHAPDNRIVLQPIGVVGLITPWNWPMHQVALKVIPALLSGCTMVLKPSEFAPLSAQMFAEIAHEAGMPRGVFNLVFGDGATTGMRMVTHPDITMISFTGSTNAGRSVLRGAADTFKRVALELGGKGANLIFADADGEAVERGVRRCFSNSGQSCNAPTRMLVERSIYDETVETARRIAETVQVGQPEVAGPHIGPVVSSRQFDRVQTLIETGIREGARLVIGGPGRPSGFNRGYFVQPTIFADVNNQMTIARDEIFGPVL